MNSHYHRVSIEGISPFKEKYWVLWELFNVLQQYGCHIPRESYHMGRRSPAMKIVTKICSFVTFVTIVQGTIVTNIVVRY